MTRWPRRARTPSCETGRAIALRRSRDGSPSPRRPHYAKGEYEDAAQDLEQAARKGTERELITEARYWLAETYYRLNRFQQADQLFRQVAQGPRAAEFTVWSLHSSGWTALRLGEWSRARDTFTPFLTAAPYPREAWARPGLGLALSLVASDPEGARTTVRGLEAKRSPLVQPVLVRLMRALVDAKKPTDVPSLAQELLGATLTPAMRAYVLVLKGDAHRLAGNRDDARTQYELAQRMDSASATGWYASYRLAQSNFELREFAQAVGDLARVAAAAPSPDARVAALLLQGETAYYGRDHVLAASAFRRVLADAPEHAQASSARLGLAWALMRHDRPEDARREFLAFVQAQPNDPRAPDALELASELALRDDKDRATAQQLLDRVIAAFPRAPRTEFARLNRALLLMRTGDVAGAQTAPRDWIRRAPFPPLLGRAQAALGATLLAAGRQGEAANAFTQAQAEGAGPLSVRGPGPVAAAQSQA